MARGGSACRIAVIVLSLSVLAAVCLINRPELATLYGVVSGDSTQQTPGRTGKSQDNRSSLLLGDAAQVRGEYNIPLNPMGELDFMTKGEVYDLRKKCVLQHKGLIKEGYEPSEAVFGAIEDKSHGGVSTGYMAWDRAKGASKALPRNLVSC